METPTMNLYRGCVVSFFLVIIGIASILFATVIGILGLFLLPALVGFCYLLVDTILVELLWWDRDRNG
jgi:hypothetical protein